ncbi:LemA family protein [Guggenheimella bovis]
MHPVLYALIALALLAILFIIGSFNRLKGLQLSVQEAFSTMDVYLKKRYDLVPNLVETVKRYAEHEKGTLESTAEARSRAVQATTLEEKVRANEELTERISTIRAIVENYPELKADVGFMKLQNQLEEIEEDIADSRLYYNGNVKLYNTTKHTFPTLLISSLFHFKDEPFFEAELNERGSVRIGEN